MSSVTTRRFAVLVAALAIGTAACGGAGTSSSPIAATTPGPGATTAAPLAGNITIDGSSTVYPITEAVAEEFQKANPGVRVTVAFSGTGGGFKKFCNGETDMNDASRPIKTEDTADAKSEATLCKDKGIGWVELGIATRNRVVPPQRAVIRAGQRLSEGPAIAQSSDANVSHEAHV